MTRYLLLFAMLLALTVPALADDTSDRIRDAREAMDQARSEAYAAGDAKAHEYALLTHRLLVMATTAHNHYLDVISGRVELPEPEPEVEPEPEEPTATRWTVPDDAEIRHLQEGQTILEIRYSIPDDGRWIVYDLQGQEIEYLHIRNDVHRIAVMNGTINAQGRRGEAVRVVGGNIKQVRLVNLHVTGGHSGMTIQTFDGERMRDVQVLDCTIEGNFILDRGSHSQGIYVGGVSTVLIEGNTFRANGWIPGRDETATIFNHTMYFMHADDVVVRGNVAYDSPSFFVKLSSNVEGGTSKVLIEGNVSHNSANGITIGRSSGKEPQTNHNVTVRGNRLLLVGRSIGVNFQGYGVDGAAVKWLWVLDNEITPTDRVTRDPITWSNEPSSVNVVVEGNDTAKWDALRN